jgi:two-component system, cell cycle sensor histidine kinase and response regulator CckA
MATILIVDDIPANRKVLVALLRFEGHRTIEAANGREGLAAVKAGHPDLVVTDVLMPVMDGYEFIRQLRLDPATSGVPVVFCTAHYGEREARELALSSGVSYVLTKPAESSDVLRVVGRALSGERRPSGPSEDAALTPDFDREHLRLVTDKLSEKAEDLKTANARLRALINIGLDLASERDPDRVLGSVCASARDLFDATYVTLGILDRNDRTVRRFITCGLDAGDRIKPGDAVSGILATVVAERRAMRGGNLSGDAAGRQVPEFHPDAQAFLAAPIASPAHVYGWICLVRNDGRAFTEDDEPLVMALAGQVGRIHESGYFHELARQDRDRAQRYLDTAEVILLALDIEGRITLANRYACSVLGWTADELQGLDWIETCLPVGNRDAQRERFRDVLGGDLSIAEHAVLTRSAEERLIEWRNTVLRDDGGRVVGTFSSGTDITQRRRAEEEIRDRAQLSALSAAIGLSLTSNDSLGAALQHCAEALVSHLGTAYAGLWTLNQHEGVLELQASAGLDLPVNRLHEQVSLAQSTGRVARDRKPHRTNAAIGDLDVIDQEWARREGIVADAGRPLIVDGRVVGVMMLLSRRALSDAVVSALASVADHIALGIERLQSAEALRAGEERVRFALQSAGVGIWDMDCATGILQWSETIEAHYGLRPGTFNGAFAAFVERIHPDDRESMLETFGEAMKSGADFTMKHRSIWPDGTVRWLSGAGRFHLGDHGMAVRGVGISLDVTEQRVLEEQLRQSQKLEAIGQLAGGVAHDFNNVLTAILGFSELILSGLSSDDPLKADVLEIKRAGERAAGLTRQLLAFGRKQILQPRILSVNAIIGGTESMLKRLILEHVNLTVRLAQDVGLIVMDPTQLEQILINLVVNAADAMPRGGRLTIETENVKLDEHYRPRELPVTPGDYMMLSVSDTGVGMDEATSRHVFEPFFTTKGVGKGTGLGLATVYGIVKQSGGDIRVHSERGRGSTFKIYLPQVMAGEAGGIERLNEGVDMPRGSETILLVEDDDAVRMLARVTLERTGYRVLQAGDPKAAMLVANGFAGPIHLLLSDVIMPESEGTPLFDRLTKKHRGLRILYMSGYADEAILRHGLLVEGTPFLQKPFTPLALALKIRDVLEAAPTPA